MKNQSWKQMHRDYFIITFRDTFEKFDESGAHDDRMVFCNMYRYMLEALDSLPENPHNIVCVAMNEKLKEYRETMRKIKEHFSNR